MSLPLVGYFGLPSDRTEMSNYVERNMMFLLRLYDILILVDMCHLGGVIDTF